MYALETKWTLGFILGTPAWIVWIAGCLVVALIFEKRWRRTRDQLDREGALMVWASAAVLFIASLAFALSPLAYYPYEKQYHSWQTVSGEVQEVGKRLISSDKSMSERYVLVIDGQPYGVDDTRAATVKAGDTVSLWCKRDWQYASVPGWVCRWNQ